MKKRILVIVVVIIMLVMMAAPVSAVVKPPVAVKDALLKGIWGAIMDLQNQITALTKRVDDIQLTPGPQGPRGADGAVGPQGIQGLTGTCSCAISLEEFNALEARVAALECGDGVCIGIENFQNCPRDCSLPCLSTNGGIETCDSMDNDCNGLIDEGDLCSNGQSCVSGKCTTPTDSQGITSISPTFTYGNDVALTIIGTNFQQGFTAKMIKSTDTSKIITARSVGWDSATQVKCWFTIPDPRLRGTYNVILTMPDGTTRSLPNGFEVK